MNWVKELNEYGVPHHFTEGDATLRDNRAQRCASCDDYFFETMLIALAIESHGAGVLDMVVLSKRSWLFVFYIQ
jgi:hypothetical protein